MNTPLDVSILIVNWNAGDLLRRCVESIPAALGELTGELIIVDNASADDSLDRLPEAPGLRIVRRPDNVGFAAATNQAAGMASGRQFLLLNPDTECQPQSIRILSEYLDTNANVAAVGPRLRHADGRVQRSCWRGRPGVRSVVVDALYLWKLPWLPLVRDSEVATTASDEAVNVDHLLGACMLIPRAAWDRVGDLDECYFLFLEETDWCLRARRAGYHIVYLPSAEVMHVGEHSVHQAPIVGGQHYHRNLVRLYRDAPSASLHVAALKAAIALGACVRLGLWSWRLLGPRRKLALGMLQGYGRVLRELPSY